MKRKKCIGKYLVIFILIFTVVIGNALSIQAAGVKLNKNSLTLVNGCSYTLKISGSAKKVTWSTSNKAVVSLSSVQNYSVKITGKKAGSAIVSAKVGKKIYECKIKVINVKMNITSKTVYVGNSYQLKVSGAKASKWTSSNVSVASVTSKGKVTGKKAGTAYIYAYVGNSRIKGKITVKKKQDNTTNEENLPSTTPSEEVPETIEILDSKVFLYLGEGKEISVENTSAVSFESTDTSVATVSSNDKKMKKFYIKAVGYGKCEIIVTCGGGKQAIVQVKVRRRGSESLCLEYDGLHIYHNDPDEYDLDKCDHTFDLIAYNGKWINMNDDPQTVKAALLCDPVIHKFYNDYLKPGMTDLDKLYAIQEFYLDNNIKYHGNYQTDPYVPFIEKWTCPYCTAHVRCSNAIALLYGHEAICEGYALATKFLCTVADIPNGYIQNPHAIGDIGHAWNVVQLDGKWYHLDLVSRGAADHFKHKKGIDCKNTDKRCERYDVLNFGRIYGEKKEEDKIKSFYQVSNSDILEDKFQLIRINEVNKKRYASYPVKPVYEGEILKNVGTKTKPQYEVYYMPSTAYETIRTVDEVEDYAIDYGMDVGIGDKIVIDTSTDAREVYQQAERTETLENEFIYRELIVNTFNKSNQLKRAIDLYIRLSNTKLTTGTIVKLDKYGRFVCIEKLEKPYTIRRITEDYLLKRYSELAGVELGSGSEIKLDLETGEFLGIYKLVPPTPTPEPTPETTPEPTPEPTSESENDLEDQEQSEDSNVSDSGVEGEN